MYCETLLMHDKQFSYWGQDMDMCTDSMQHTLVKNNSFTCLVPRNWTNSEKNTVMHSYALNWFQQACLGSYVQPNIAAELTLDLSNDINTMRKSSTQRLANRVWLTVGYIAFYITWHPFFTADQKQASCINERASLTPWFCYGLHTNHYC